MVNGIEDLDGNREQESQRDIIQWMWKPSSVDEHNIGLMIAASFIFSGGNYKRLAYYWIYLAQNNLLTTENLSGRIANAINNVPSVIGLLRAGYSIYGHQKEFDLNSTKTGLANALLVFEETNDKAHEEGINFQVDVRTYAQALDKKDWTLRKQDIRSTSSQ